MNHLVQYSESFVIRKRKKAPSKLLAKKQGSYQVWRGVPINKNWNLEICYFIGVPGKGIQSSEKCNLIDINRKWGISISSANCNQFFERGMHAVSLFLTHILGDTHDEAGATDSAVNGFGWSSLATNKDSPIEIYFASDARFV